MKKKSIKNDIILIATLLVAAGLIWAVITLTRTPGAYVEVTINGESVSRLPLSEDTEAVFGEGKHTNKLVIKSGRASVIEASCPDHLCIKQGEASRDGETIVCLPNKFVVTIIGGEKSNTDFISK